VSAARAGRYDEALVSLQRLASAGDAPAQHDLVVVLVWAGRQREAIKAFERIAPAGSAPDYVQRAAAAAYRAERRFAEAERLARAGVLAKPQEGEWARLLTGVLSDSGRGPEAVALMQRQVREQPTDAENWVALGNAALGPDPAAASTDALFLALRAFTQANRLQPSNRDASAAAAAVLSRLGAPFGAAQQLPEASLALRVDQAGRQVRWATQLTPPSPARRFEAIDAALARIDLLIAEVRNTQGADPALLPRLQGDRIVALRQRERWADTLTAADAMRTEGVALPAHVRQAEADALLALRRPEDARAAYIEVLAVDPLNREAMVGRFFAEVETEDFAAAFATVDALAAREPVARYLPRDPTPRPHSDWLDSRILAASARSYADMQAEAWLRMKPLADGAPALSYLRSSLAAVAAGRGWPRLADEEIHIAASLADDDRGIQAGLADSAMRRQRWAEARERVAALQAAYPDDGAVQRSARDLSAHDLAEVDAGVVLRHETGSAQAAPGSGVDAHLRLYSPPIAEWWRAVAVAERHTASPPEGKALRNRFGLGAKYRGADTQFEATAWSNRGTLDKAGFSVAGSWAPDDHVSLSANAEAFAVDTPLRALLYGITANAAGVSAGYTWNEASAVSASFRALDFTDGNQRRSVVLAWGQRLLTQPHLQLDLRPGFYASTNSLAGAPYFNPSRDRSFSLALEADHVIWRRYERSLSQNLSATVANYWQQGYGAGAIGGLRYTQAWRHDPLTEWRYGIELNRSIYDGVPERNGIAFVNFNHRF
jgi:biofilm PGA synthesis protein PgaA